MSEPASTPITRTFYVDPPYHGPPQIVTTILETLVRVHPDGSYLPRCNACSGDDEYDFTRVIWNIVVREADKN
jgi:hypothetical protein